MTVWSLSDPNQTPVLFTQDTVTRPGHFITSTVTLNRGSNQGLFNSSSEMSFNQIVSPANTEWAFANLNGNMAVAANDFANLTFAVWTTALGGGGGGSISNIIDRPGVLHIIDQDIYIDIEFSEFGLGGGSNGEFAFTRAGEPIPEPSSALLLSLAGVIVLRRKR